MSRAQKPIIPYSVPLQVIDKTLLRLLPLSEAEGEQRRKKALASSDMHDAQRYILMSACHGKGTAVDSDG